MTLKKDDILLVNRSGTSHKYDFQSAVQDFAAYGISESSIPNAAAWDIKDGPFFRNAGATINNPTITSDFVNTSGLIRLTSEVSSWGSNFKFPGGQQQAGGANAIIPYFVEATNIIRCGFATLNIN